MIQVIAVALLAERLRRRPWPAASAALVMVGVAGGLLAPAARWCRGRAWLPLGPAAATMSVPPGAERRGDRRRGRAGPEPVAADPAGGRTAGPARAIRRRPGLAAREHHPLADVGAGHADLEGRVTSINEAACEILGMPQRQALGAALDRRIPQLARFLVEAGPVGTVRRAEITRVRPDGAMRNLGISATPLSDHTGEIIGRVHPLPGSDRAAPHADCRSNAPSAWPASAGWPPASRTRSATRWPASRARSRCCADPPGADARAGS